MRRPIVAGNWKLNGTRAEARALVEDLLPRLSPTSPAEVAMCPPFTALETVGTLIADHGIALGAQDMFWKEKGAYTGEISAGMLLDLGVKYVILGHSERRGRFGVADPDFDQSLLAAFGDNDNSVNRKARAVIAAGLRAIICCGEMLEERQSGATDEIVRAQVQAALNDIEATAVPNIVIAYEPVWAIGTGEVCAPDEADRVCGVIRSVVAGLYGADAGEAIRIQYGGSAKPDNAADLLSRPNIDGALVGGASLKAADFAAIIAAA